MGDSDGQGKDEAEDKGKRVGDERESIKAKAELREARDAMKQVKG